MRATKAIKLEIAKKTTEALIGKKVAKVEEELKIAVTKYKKACENVYIKLIGKEVYEFIDNNKIFEKFMRYQKTAGIHLNYNENDEIGITKLANYADNLKYFKDDNRPTIPIPHYTDTLYFTKNMPGVYGWGHTFRIDEFSAELLETWNEAKKEFNTFMKKYIGIKKEKYLLQESIHNNIAGCTTDKQIRVVFPKVDEYYTFVSESKAVIKHSSGMENILLKYLK